jgi:hypothetical protein
MKRVTTGNRNHMLAEYNTARGGAGNENTDSDAMFVAWDRWTGVYIYNESLRMWVGVSNATARISYYGHEAPNTEEALDRTINLGFEVWLSLDAVERYRLIADKIAEWKAMGGTVIVARVSL